MSQASEDTGEDPELSGLIDPLVGRYHILALLLAMGFMLWNRARSYSNFIVDGEILFSGQDPWYHYRSTMYVVENWPSTMPFDPWTYFPSGTRSGQFGTLLDQVVATVALIIGLGSPDEYTVGLVAIFAPAVIGTLAAIPTYLIGRRLAGRFGGVTALTIVSLSSGLFLARGLVGTYDHQIAEALLQVTAVMAVMVAVSVAERDKPIYEQFTERDVDALRETVGYSILAGFAIALYLWTWPPAVLLLGILGAFFLLWLNLEFVRGKSPEHVAIAGAVMMGAVVVFSLASIRTFEITATDHSLLQPLLAFVIGGGCAFMAWLARYMEAESYGRSLYPTTVGGIIATIALGMAVLTPELFSYFVDQILRVVGFTASPSATSLSVGEAQPLRRPGRLYANYGLALFVAILGALLVLGQQFGEEKATAQRFLIVVWAAFILAASFTQQRFMVYLVFPVAALNSVAVEQILTWTDFSLDGDIEVYEILTLGAIALAIVGTLLLVSPAVSAGETGPGPAPEAWGESLEWLNESSPPEGAYGTGDEQRLEYYGTYPTQENFEYQDGEYGVMSWWDYGHLITVQGKRIPNANPFQQGATTAANFLISPNETQANRVLDKTSENGATTRYVAVDWKMVTTYGSVNGKFFAPPRFYNVSNVSAGDYYKPILNRNGTNFNRKTQMYYNSTVVRLYEYHGSAVNPSPIVLDWEIGETRRGQARVIPSDGQAIRQFNSTREARQYVENDSTSQVGGIGTLPSQRVPAMEHYRYVGSSERDGFRHPIDRQASMTNPTWTKIFERVPGGTIAGTAPENATVRASVEMENELTNQSFSYTQRARTGSDGEFEMRVPYSTTGYDNWGPDEGYTNVSVRATGPYEFRVSKGLFPIRTNATAQMTESQVIGENETATTVNLSSNGDPQIDINPSGS
jgi:dolichyl-diphosphooligosaccharide--protein glycosyltransferase